MQSAPSPDADDAALPPRVLLVDDDDVTRMLTAVALHDRGFQIIEAGDGQEALDRVLSQPFDIVVLDAMMPGLDGFETCRLLRGAAGFENLPVLMLTGLDDEASIARAYEVGATDFFVKSNQWSLLSGRLRYLLRSARTRLELERHKAQLARAQDLARMGSFEWRRSLGGLPGALSLSAEARRVFTWPLDEPLTLGRLLQMVPKSGRRMLVHQLRHVLQENKPLAEDVSVYLPGRRLRVVHVEAEPEPNEHGLHIGYTGIVQDVTERRIAEDRIRHLANFDAVTGLPNRHQLMWRTDRALEQARRHGHQVALLLIDLDRFKMINDTLGHGAGDELLIEVSRRLRACVRHCDKVAEGTLETVGGRAHRSLEAVGRLGGDEFVALLPEVGGEVDAERVSLRILEALREPVFVGGQECFVTCSVGVSIFPRDGISVADLLRNADVAMYSVKTAGRNACALYSPMLAGSGRDKLELESALHKAIERNELVLFYQPKVDVRSASMVGAEALMRWQRGDTLVPPNDFIPLAEETGLIVPLSEWALREAALQVAAWEREFGFTDSIAVNLPTRLFERTDLLHKLHESVMAAGVRHQSIQLEITETGLMKDLQMAMPSLAHLNDIGVEISIDDFGTGYSSLSYLTTLPISELKIDRSFVRNLGTSAQSSAVITAIIALARSLGLRVVAEGVENLTQMQELHRLGCHVMQGFLFSTPVPGHAVGAWQSSVMLPPYGERFEFRSNNFMLPSGMKPN